MEKYTQQKGVHDQMINSPKISVYLSERLEEIKKIEDNLFYGIERYRIAVFMGQPNEAARWSKIVEELKNQYAKFQAHE